VVRRPRRSRRLLAGVAALALLSLGGALPGAVAPAGAAPGVPGSEEDLGVLNERYNLARLRLDRATAAMQATEQRLQSTRDRAVEIREIVRARAARLYRGTAGGGIAGLLGSSDVNELARRAEYVGAAAKPDRALLRDLNRALDDLADELRANQEAQRRLRAEADAAAAARRKLLAEAAAARAAAALQARAQGAGPIGTPRVMQATSSSSGSGLPAVPPGSPPPTAGKPPSSAPKPTTPAPPPSSRAAIAVAFARAQLGKPYSFATSGPDTFDCSGLTMAAWRAAGVSMAHYSVSQANSFPKVTWEQLQPGDLVLFYADLHHVGLYIGGGQMIHAPRTGDVVKIAPAWRTEFQFGVRPG
jgi:cell wall-associated NlpC family hydrolase